MFTALFLMMPPYLLMGKVHVVDTLGGLNVAYAGAALPFCVWTKWGYCGTIPVVLNGFLVSGLTLVIFKC